MSGADYPDPTPEMLSGDRLFDAIWSAIKGWDIQRVHGSGYSGASGNDARHIYDAVKAAEAENLRGLLTALGVQK